MATDPKKYSLNRKYPLIELCMGDLTNSTDTMLRVKDPQRSSKAFYTPSIPSSNLKSFG